MTRECDTRHAVHLLAQCTPIEEAGQVDKIRGTEQAHEARGNAVVDLSNVNVAMSSGDEDDEHVCHRAAHTRSPTDA